MSGLRCQAKRGVMMLRPCGEPATATCSQCQRLTCADHLANPALFVCVECDARTSASANRAIPDSSYYYDDGWAVSYRNWLLFSGSYHSGTVFDQTDPASFADRRDDDIVDTAAPDGTFLDS